MNSKSEETKQPLRDWDTYRLSAVFKHEAHHTWVNLRREGDPVRPTLHDYV